MTIEEVNIEQRGLSSPQAKRILIMLHGRGDRAINFIELSAELDLEGFSIFAIQADGNTWYPYSFLADITDNEPYLTKSLDYIDTLVNHLMKSGINSGQLYFMGFSQGACLTLEYISRHARPYGGVIALTGGLIGKELEGQRYRGDLEGTAVFIGSSDHDPHVPEYRIEESANIIQALGGEVKKVIYPGMGHTINRDEIEHAKSILNH